MDRVAVAQRHAWISKRSSRCSYPDRVAKSTLQTVRDLFLQYGVTGPIRWHLQGGEWAFIVTTHGAAAMRERELTQALQDFLRQKVAVFTDGPGWEGRGAPLDTFPSN
jgi:hypothetical protein